MYSATFLCIYLTRQGSSREVVWIRGAAEITSDWCPETGGWEEVAGTSGPMEISMEDKVPGTHSQAL